MGRSPPRRLYACNFASCSPLLAFPRVRYTHTRAYESGASPAVHMILTLVPSVYGRTGLLTRTRTRTRLGDSSRDRPSVVPLHLDARLLARRGAYLVPPTPTNPAVPG